jgi:hypothetical protein
LYGEILIDAPPSDWDWVVQGEPIYEGDKPEKLRLVP